ncbi:site-specific DNA-methyltransferase [Anoxybacillus flavithermus]|uniref:site-specific DNA-methyltransferase n=1 Tax=Anoxybacillus flavithermus TaxID=33934 RepID=UPI000B4A48DD|nr:site-specific DNA-methyltransferase [Anoxybacillus flavithermus]MBE2915684.1 site-specific DNA-methyltransferase [Anoxybacillus flavithermus]MBE2919356.1 site-specific DNA-methyltransferase [Anoxybacillus flavithermus]
MENRIATGGSTLAQKLELTWIGKGEQPKLEPRILLEDPELSYHAKERVTENDIFDNRLIFGDNLLALKALEQEFTGKIKCIYIDPPYNTGNAFEHYDDGLEHSIWLNLMKSRLEILKQLLAEDGAIFIQINDEEHAYLKVLCDEIFGRKNFITNICVKMSHLSGVKMSHVEKKIPKIKEYILMYAKNKEYLKLTPIYEREGFFNVFDRYNNFLVRDSNDPEDMSKWLVIPLRKAAQNHGIDTNNLEDYEKFCIENARNIFRTARNRSKQFEELPNDDKFREVITPTGLKKIAYKREEVIFCSERMKTIDGELVPVRPLGDIWTDIGINNLHNEGGVDFRNGKKPEKLISRVIELVTNPGDWVLDSFAGSGTTGAVAHKMGRRWIMIELGEHCHTHIIPRMKRVIDGTDQGGISKAVNWQGGGGFRYYKLAPSLLKKDKFGNWIINPEYNAEMLAEAMCKHEGFTYNPDPHVFWKQGQSTENDFIFTTTQLVTHQMVAGIVEQMKENETLLICCKAYNVNVDEFPQITIKKLPQAILNKCEFGRDDYSLNVNNLPMKEREPEQLELF